MIRKILCAATLSTLLIDPVISGPSHAQVNSAAVRDISGEEVNQQQLRVAVASRTLTWLTGTSANNDYVSVGRISNFFGFVGLRVASGQSLSRSDVALDTLAVLDAQQRADLIALSEDQASALSETHAARIDINRALEGLLIGEAVSYEDFLQLGRTYGAEEAELGRVIAQRLGDVSQTLSEDQVAALAGIRAAYISGQGQLIDLPSPDIKLPQAEKTELINSAARFLSWTTGSPDYNDFEVVGKPSQHFGFVSLRVDSNHGVTRGGIAGEVRGLLAADQKRELDRAAEHNAERFGAFLEARALLMRELETALQGDAIDQEQVAVFGAAIGEIEAEMTWAQAAAMLAVRDAMTDEQTSGFLTLRAKYTASEAAVWSDETLVRGRQLFAQCVLCHNAGANFALAPDLTGIVDREIASVETFGNYSPALKSYAEAEGTWTEDRLDAFLASPQSAIRGTFMAFTGLEDDEDRNAIIAYLKSTQ